jgi:hypothetical protein
MRKKYSDGGPEKILTDFNESSQRLDWFNIILIAFLYFSEGN